MKTLHYTNLLRFNKYTKIYISYITIPIIVISYCRKTIRAIDLGKTLPATVHPK